MMSGPGRVDSTEELKEHEKHLMKLTLDSGFVEALTALALGEPITGDNDLSRYVQVSPSRIPGDLVENLQPKDLERITRLGVPISGPTSVEGSWVPTGEDGDWSIEYGNDLEGKLEAVKLFEAIDEMMPPEQHIGRTELLPITILLPDQIATDVEKLSDVKSSWRFFGVGDRDCKLTSQKARIALSLRLISLLQAIKVTDTLVRRVNGAFTQQVLKMSPISDGVVPIKKGTDLRPGLVQLGRMAAETNRIDRKRSTSRRDPPPRYMSVASEVEKSDVRKSMLTVKLPTRKSCYIAINPDLYGELEDRDPMVGVDQKAKTEIELDLDKQLVEPEGGDYSLLRFEPKEDYVYHFKASSLSFRYAFSSKDSQLYVRENRHVRQALAYLMSLTSGVAITFYLEKPQLKQRKGSSDLEKNQGLVQPTLILPEHWFDVIDALKNGTDSGTKAGMSDDKYNSGDIRKDLYTALCQSYKKKKDEILRIYNVA